MSKEEEEEEEKGNKEYCYDYFIGLDVGTQGTKAIAYTTTPTVGNDSKDKNADNNNSNNNHIIARSSYSYDIEPNPNNIIGRAEQNPQVWIDAINFCLKDIIKNIEKKSSSSSSSPSSSMGTKKKCWILKGIGVSGQQHGMVPLDRYFNPIRNVKLWCDVETINESKELSLIGNKNIPPGFTSPKILWMKYNEHEQYEKVKWFILPHDYVNTYLITYGWSDDEKKENKFHPTTDLGDVSGSGLWDNINKTYDLNIINYIDNANKDNSSPLEVQSDNNDDTRNNSSSSLLRKLPKVLTKSNDICGYLSEQYMKDILEIESIDDKIPISIGSGDNMCSALGVGCVKNGLAVLSLGTSATIFTCTNQPVIQNQKSSSSVVAPFHDATGKNLPLVCIMSCTSVLQYVLDVFCCNPSDGTKITHDDATKILLLLEEESNDNKNLLSIKPGCDGITFLPFIGGERTPNWPNSTGTLLGLTTSIMNKMKQSSKYKIGLFYRAALEGITYVLYDALQELQNCTSTGSDNNNNNNKITTLYVVGGGSKNKLWRQMIADILQVELKFPIESESAALGAALQVCSAVHDGRDGGENDDTTGTYILNHAASNDTIQMEDTVVKPTTNKETIQLYKDGLKRYQTLSKKLFAE